MICKLFALDIPNICFNTRKASILRESVKPKISYKCICWVLRWPFLMQRNVALPLDDSFSAFVPIVLPEFREINEIGTRIVKFVNTIK